MRPLEWFELELGTGVLDHLRVALHRLLLVVLEFRLQPLREREVFVALRGDRREVVLEDFGRGLDVVVVVSQPEGREEDTAARGDLLDAVRYEDAMAYAVKKL